MDEQLKVVITAEISGLKAEVQKAQQAIKDSMNKSTVSVSEFEKAFLSASSGLSSKASAEFDEFFTDFHAQVRKLGANGEATFEELEQAFESATEGMEESTKKAYKKIYDQIKKDCLKAEQANEKAQKQIAKEAEKSAEQARKAQEKATKEIKNAYDKMAKGVKVALVAVVGAIVAVGNALLDNAENTVEYNREIAKLNSSFQAVGMSAETAGAVFDELFSIFGETDQVVEASQQIALLAQSEQEAIRWAELGAGVMATFGTSLQPETFFEAANETSKLGEATGAYVQMLEGAGVDVEKFNETLANCSSEVEKNNLILTVGEACLNEAGNAYRSVADDIIAYQGSVNNLLKSQAKLGSAMLPVNTALNDFKAQLADELTPVVADFVNNHLDEFTSALSDIAEKAGEVINFISENWETVSTIAGIIAGITVALVALNVAVGIFTLLTSPITLTILAISVVIGILIVALSQILPHVDEIKEGFIEAWQMVKDEVGKAGENIQEGWNNLKESASELDQNITEKAKNMTDQASEKFANMVNNVGEKVNNMKKNVGEAFTNIKTNISNAVSNALSTVSSIFEKMRSTMEDKITQAKDKVKSVIDDIKAVFDFEWSLPPLKLPHIDIIGKFSLNPVSVPRFSIAWNAMGGVFDAPTIFGYGNSLQGIGEDGAEAVVPLENNLGWLDKLAGMLNDRMGSRPIYLMVDKTVLGQVSADGINNITRMTGQIPIKVV